MSLCEVCQGFDILKLLRVRVAQCRDRQKALFDGEIYDNGLNHYEGFEMKHHSDIFEIKISSKGCDLCQIIFQAFEKTVVPDAEWARGVQIVFRASYSKIEVCYSTGPQESLIRLCGLDAYMAGHYVDELFRACQIKEDNSPPVLRIIEEDPKQSFRFASRWLENCKENHSSCAPSIASNELLPKRLILVGNDTQDPRLVEAFPHHQSAKWLSLSYCWGEQDPLIKLGRDTMDRLKDGISLESFDATIRDAILVTRALGISYIWIDALCIYQDKDNTEWHQEAPKMNGIYGGSVVTLVIASAPSVKSGFLEVKRNRRYIPVAYSADPVEIHKAKVFLSSEWDNSESEHDGPWSKRGWTMQEGLLPNRILYYTTSQISWTCCLEQNFERGVTDRLGDRISEILTYSDDTDIAFGSGFLWNLPTFLKFKRFENNLPTNPDFALMSHPETFHLWYDLIEDYTQRQFKKISDRLMAISGLAKIYAAMIRSPTYVAGLWKEDLLRGLLWHVTDRTLILDSSASNTDFPSWSWASVGYVSIKNDLKSSDDLHGLSKVEDVQIDLVDPQDPFSAVQSACICITGPLKRLSRLYCDEWKSPNTSLTKLESYISSIIDEEGKGNIPLEFYSPSRGHFSVLLLLRGIDSLYLMVLEATGGTHNGITLYRRVGRLKLRYTHPSSVAHPEMNTRLENAENPLAMRLGLHKQKRRVRLSPNAVFMEVKMGRWPNETIIMV